MDDLGSLRKERSACFCVGPQNGQQFCPCEMRLRTPSLNLDKGNRVGVGAQVIHPYGVPPMVQQGWECPRCKTINAPHVPTCMGCKPPKVDYKDSARS